MKSKPRLFLHRVCAFLAGLALTSFAHSDVIKGTGTPSSTQLGLTDAVGFAMTETGPGHLLVVPYFTTQNGQMSVLHLVNTDVSNGKVLKVRYRGAGNGDTLQDFLVLLSPGDVWTAAVVAGQNGLPQLMTADQSCTYPNILAMGALPFGTERLNPAWSDAIKAVNTREGSIEAIVVADIPTSASYGASNNERSAVYNAIKPINGVPACTPSVLAASLLNDLASEAAAASFGFATPSGGVAGSWYIIDVAGSTTFAGSATAFRAVDVSGKNARGNFVLFPQSGVQVSRPERYTADPLLVSAGVAGRVKDASGNLSNLTTAAVITALFVDLPDLSTPYYLPASALNARITAGDLSKLIEVRQLSNQYSIESSISAKTDWVFAMPTKRFSVALDYSQPKETAMVFSAVPPAAVNNQYFHDGNTYARRHYEVDIDPENFKYIVCQFEVDPAFSYDRNAARRYMGVTRLIQGTPVMNGVCGSAQIFTFGDDESSALYPKINKQKIQFGIHDVGWAKMLIFDGLTGLGLPMLGASFIKLTNPQAQPGVLGNYGISWPHIRDGVNWSYLQGD